MIAPHVRGRAVAAGLASGSAQILAGVTMYVAGIYFNPASLLVSIVVLGLGVVGGMRWSLGSPSARHASYGIAARTGVVIGTLTGLMYAAYNVVTIEFIYADFLDQMAQARTDLLVAHGTAAEDAQILFGSIRGGLSTLRVAVANLAVLSILGAVIASVAAVRVRGRSGSDA